MSDEVVYKFAPLVEGEHLAEYPARDLSQDDLNRMTKEQRAHLREYSQQERAIFVSTSKRKNRRDDVTPEELDEQIHPEPVPEVSGAAEELATGVSSEELAGEAHRGALSEA